ncbi:SDR family NAD(P)-dependent oxidoreductase [Lacrimispora sphenoides]|uniref:NAD(P)-dependent dehydrogenase, short-chain alcohol dehydrogenase family n=1 Tax=Lacrimispora sphenoides JCM 1415 TaxID=1297793 RepID=A0ABY1C987_9FIRM|nr:SDR family oxidoreductase [Lacrimispora sphenoides]SET82205.1 NAD(P)-dependent dehydrogenase, short-chain alcohol dehydrogenase family [[Clostridium] sphenoides JCM 1415]SUY51541.1 Dehydrogenases with different specificities (related to short-chain alcohol dehydrogenases) [Lacrimispora sphenoides]
MEGKKVAVVTGGSSGMGLAISKKLQNLGVHVIVFDLQTPPENFEFYRVDISDDGQIKSALSHILRLDIIVNNAGVYFEKYLEDTTNEEINTMVDINIKGTYLVTRNAFEKIKASKGSIVIIASCLGLVPELTSPLYCTTKAGLVMLTKCLAQQYAELGIRVNCVLPGPINTPLLQKSFSDKETADRCSDRIPLKRIGEPEDIANMVAFLISDDAGYITGGAFPVDGGVSSSSMYSK